MNIWEETIRKSPGTKRFSGRTPGKNASTGSAPPPAVSAQTSRRQNHQEGCDINQNMKLNSDTVMLINLFFRIFLIMILLKEFDMEKTRNVKPLKYGMDPISKRVFLIFINGLQKDFLSYNSTPFLTEMLESYGSFGITMTGYMETNGQGLRTILSGRYTPPFPFSWLVTPCGNTILDQISYKCAIGSLPEDVPMSCYFPDRNPLQNFHKFPDLFSGKNYKNALYILTLDLDPVLVKNYQSRLKRIDDDIRFLASTIDNIFVDNKTTFVLTSARGSPVGKTLSIDSPVLAWGSGIANSSDVTYMWQTDLTAMLCALLGISFPSKLFGVIPMSMMELHEYYELELTFYTIRHFEKILETVDVNNYLIELSDLELEQVTTRLQSIIYEIRKSKLDRTLYNSSFVIVLLTLWGVSMVSFSTLGVAHFFCRLKSLFLLLLVVTATITFTPLGSELPVLSELSFFWISQNFDQIYETFSKHIPFIFESFFLTISTVTVAGIIGNHTLVAAIFIPVILWPFINGTYRGLNRYVLFTRLVSGVIVCVLPLTRVFGEMPDPFFITSISFLFLLNFYSLLFVFKRQFDAHTKVNYFLILLTNFCISLNSPEMARLKPGLSSLLFVSSLLSVYLASGTLLSRLLKAFLSLFIPVLMFSVKIECVFYLSVVFHLFTWIFIEYHSSTSAEVQLNPSIFSVEPKTCLKSMQFSREDFRQVFFFVVYCYLCYFAIGHFPDLHSYDLYVLPTFVYSYPKAVSYSLGIFKFFLPFFLVTASFITVCVLKEKDFNSLIAIAVWLSDMIGCCFVFYSQFFNLVLQQTVFPAKFSYFVIQQFAAVSVILSYFMGKGLLLGQDTFVHSILEGLKQRIT